MDMSKETASTSFSNELEHWMTSKSAKTVAALNDLFAEKSLAIIILVLMFLPALPLPTGGVSHVFEVISMLIALQLMIGRRTIWLPKDWATREITGMKQKKVINGIVKTVRWLEKFSRPRLVSFMQSTLGLFIAGLALFAFSLAAFLSPPFSGLDTFPSIGAVVVALSLVLDDFVVLVVGILAGIGGIALIVTLGTAVFDFVHHLF